MGTKHWIQNGQTLNNSDLVNNQDLQTMMQLGLFPRTLVAMVHHNGVRFLDPDLVTSFSCLRGHIHGALKGSNVGRLQHLNYVKAVVDRH